MQFSVDDAAVGSPTCPRVTPWHSTTPRDGSQCTHAARQTRNKTMTRIMCVGVATLDVVNTVARYPDEDSEVRASQQALRMGGNAANTAVVLAQMGDTVSWVGNLAPSCAVIDASFAAHGVDTSLATRLSEGVTPTSYITLSAATGSRSIVHYRDLPEYTADSFLRLDLPAFDWIHFEGRAIDELGAMITHARAQSVARLSLEVEKPRPGIESLFPHVDLLMFSRDYAQAKNEPSASALLQSLPPGTRASCTWGADGAWAIDCDGQTQHVAAPRLEVIADTVGAGDAFNAALVHALHQGDTLFDALSTAVALASLTCTHHGLDLGNLALARRASGLAQPPN